MPSGCPTSRGLPEPGLTDQPELTLDRARDASEARGDFLVAITLHPPGGNLPQPFIAQPVEPDAELLGDQGHEFGRGRVADDLVEPGGASIALAALGQHGLPHDPSAPSFPSTLALDLVERLPRGDHHQEPPEVV